MNIGKIRKLSCLVVLLLLTAAVTVTAYGAPGVYVGDQAPEFSLPLVSGENVQVNYGGKLTVLNFWAAWCSDCRNEMPEINDFVKAYGSRLTFYAVDRRESAEKVTQYLNENHYDLPVLLDESGELAKQFAIQTIPTTIVINSQQQIIFRKAGEMTRAELEGIVADNL